MQIHSIALNIIGSFGTFKLQVCGMCSEIKPLFYTHRCHEKDLAISPRLVVVNALVVCFFQVSKASCCNKKSPSSPTPQQCLGSHQLGSSMVVANKKKGPANEGIIVLTWPFFPLLLHSPLLFCVSYSACCLLVAHVSSKTIYLPRR